MQLRIQSLIWYSNNMTKDEELEQLRHENTVLREAGLRKDEELVQSRKANQELREGLRLTLFPLHVGPE